MIFGLYAKIAATAVVAVVLAGSHWRAYTAGKATVQAEWTAEKVLQLEANIKAIEDARLKEQAWQVKLNGAQNDAAIRTKKLQTSVDIARGDADRLRGDIDAIHLQVPHLTRDAVNRYALASGAVFDQCVRSYTRVAAEADAIGSERQTLIDAWPK